MTLFTAGLLGFAAGCTHTSPLSRPDPAAKVAVDESGALKHKAPTYCAFGDMLATAAFAPDKTPDEKRQAREEAKLSYQKAIETEPKHVAAYVSLARIQQAGEEYAAAVETYGKAIQLAPTNGALWYDLGLCQGRMKQWEDAAASLRKACELSTGDRTHEAARLHPRPGRPGGGGAGGAGAGSRRGEGELRPGPHDAPATNCAARGEAAGRGGRGKGP
ncbi:MAG: hypothetical protein U0797_28050 [Gemmataceae bacterium]